MVYPSITADQLKTCLTAQLQFPIYSPSRRAVSDKSCDFPKGHGSFSSSIPLKCPHICPSHPGVPPLGEAGDTRITLAKLQVTPTKLQVTLAKLQVTPTKLQVTLTKLQVTSTKLQVTRSKLTSLTAETNKL